MVPAERSECEAPAARGWHAHPERPERTAGAEPIATPQRFARRAQAESGRGARGPSGPQRSGGERARSGAEGTGAAGRLRSGATNPTGETRPGFGLANGRSETPPV